MALRRSPQPGLAAPARRRDRRGRGPRGPLAWPPVPGMRTRSEQFDELVLDAVGALERRLGRELSELEVAVEEVPPSDPAPWEGGVALGRLFPAEGRLPARIVVYRRPVQTRATDSAELAQLVHDVVAEQAAQMLGIDPDDLT